LALLRTVDRRGSGRTLIVAGRAWPGMATPDGLTSRRSKYR
jgi:hypothetical protein